MIVFAIIFPCVEADWKCLGGSKHDGEEVTWFKKEIMLRQPSFQTQRSRDC